MVSIGHQVWGIRIFALKNNRYLVLFFLFSLVWQQLLPQNSLNISSKILKYHNLTNKSELAIVERNYKSACKNYTKAFRLLPGFASDHYNALIVAQKLAKKNNIVKKNLSYFYHRGICEDFFKQFYNSNTSKIAKTKSNIKINLLLAQKIDSLFIEDQKVRATKGNDRGLVRKIDSSNYVFFVGIVKEYGFPNENSLGVECSLNKKGINLMKIRTLLKHFSLNREKGVDDILNNALRDGELKPEVYAELISFINENYYNYCPIGTLGNDKYILCDSIQTKEIVNVNRKKIGLYSIDEQVMKIKYKIENPDSLFRLTETLGVLKLDYYPEKYVEFVRKNCQKI